MNWMSDAFLRLRVGAMAMEDAEVGAYNEDQAVLTLVGPESPAFEPTSNDEDRRLQHRRTNTTLRDELAEDSRARDTARVGEWPLPVALPVALVLFLIEWWASARVLVGIGVEPTSALVLGAALASGVFALAGYCASTAKRKLVYALGVLAFAVLIVALTILRLHEVASEDGDMRTDMASAIVLVVLSLGPAFLGELVLRRISSALHARRDLRSSSRQLRAEERGIESAEREIKARLAQRTTWIRQNAIGRAEYRRVWDLERSRVVAKETVAGASAPTTAAPPRATPASARPASSPPTPTTSAAMPVATAITTGP